MLIVHVDYYVLLYIILIPSNSFDPDETIREHNLLLVDSIKRRGDGTFSIKHQFAKSSSVQCFKHQDKCYGKIGCHVLFYMIH